MKMLCESTHDDEDEDEDEDIHINTKIGGAVVGIDMYIHEHRQGLPPCCYAKLGVMVLC